MLKNLVKRIIREMVAQNEISFMTSAFADSDDKKNHDEQDSRKRRSQKNDRTEKMRKMNFGKRFMKRLPILHSF